jgi:hypothetical protein
MGHNGKENVFKHVLLALIFSQAAKLALSSDCWPSTRGVSLMG